MKYEQGGSLRDQEYADWIAKVDTACWKLAGLSYMDMDDCPYRSWFEDGVKPTTAAKRAIRYSNGEDI